MNLELNLCLTSCNFHGTRYSQEKHHLNVFILETYRPNNSLASTSVTFSGSHVTYSANTENELPVKLKTQEFTATNRSEQWGEK